MCRSVTILAALSGLLVLGPDPDTHDLVIHDARILDVRSGSVRDNQLLVIDDGLIRDVRPMDGTLPRAHRTLDARGGLVTPGLIDVHHHTEYVLGDSLTPGGGFVTRLSMRPDSIRAYRDRFAREYLPYGVTTVRDAGSAEADLPMLRAWMTPSPTAPDFHPVGGALVSYEEGRVPFAGHAVVMDPVDARERIRRYHDLGIRNIKLYWRLREPEFQAALDEALRLGMNVTGHVDFRVLSLDRAIDLGLRQYEHAYTVAVAALSDEQWANIWERSLPEAIGDRTRGRFLLAVMAYMHELGPENDRMAALIHRLAVTDSTLTPTLHIFGQRFSDTYFATPSLGDFDDVSGLTPDQRRWAADGYALLADYVLAMHRAGVRLTIGTDWLDPGKAALSEMLLLHDAGIPMADVFRIATLNGAFALGIGESVGSIEPGMRADLVIFVGDPLRDPADLLGARTVIRAGEIVGAR